MNTPERLLTYTDAGSIAGVSHTIIGKWVKDHGLPTRRMPGSTRRRIRHADLIEYLRNLPVGGDDAETSATSAT